MYLFLLVQVPEAGKAGRGLLGPKFVPNVVSNVVFLMSTIISVSIPITNYKGLPFMKGDVEYNRIVSYVRLIRFL